MYSSQEIIWRLWSNHHVDDATVRLKAIQLLKLTFVFKIFKDATMLSSGFQCFPMFSKVFKCFRLFLNVLLTDFPSVHPVNVVHMIEGFPRFLLGINCHLINLHKSVLRHDFNKNHNNNNNNNKSVNVVHMLQGFPWFLLCINCHLVDALKHVGPETWFQQKTTTYCLTVLAAFFRPITSVRVSKAITLNSSSFWVNLDMATAVPGSQLINETFVFWANAVKICVCWFFLSVHVSVKMSVNPCVC